MIEQYFAEGGNQAEKDLGRDMTTCPYDEGTEAYTWWTRGYAYQFRIFRALMAEKDRTAAFAENIAYRELLSRILAWLSSGEIGAGERYALRDEIRKILER